MLDDFSIGRYQLRILSSLTDLPDRMNALPERLPWFRGNTHSLTYPTYPNWHSNASAPEAAPRFTQLGLFPQLSFTPRKGSTKRNREEKPFKTKQFPFHFPIRSRLFF
jgi:hypothetical protein